MSAESASLGPHYEKACRQDEVPSGGLAAERKPRKTPRREIELDFIRGLAILMVLDFHAPVHWMSYPLHRMGFPNFGWAGVNVFFVLSGFLVGGLLMREWRVSGRIDSRRFLVRRGFKIWPQYYVFLLLVLLTRHHSVHDLWGNLLNIQNYTGGIPHTWSLAVEEHAYLLLAFGLAWAAHKGLRIRTLGFWLAGTCAVVVVSRLWLIEHGHEVVNRTHTRIEGILYGVLLAMLFHFRPGVFRRLQAWWALWLGAAAAALVFLRFQTDAPWAASLGWDAADLLGIAMLMLLYRPQGTQRNPVYRLVAAIGVYSYGIYLWHVSVIAPSLALAAHLPHKLAPLAVATLPVAGGILLGAFATRIVELPALKLRDRVFPRRIDSPVSRRTAPEARELAESETHQSGIELSASQSDRPQVATEVEQLA